MKMKRTTKNSLIIFGEVRQVARGLAYTTQGLIVIPDEDV